MSSKTEQLIASKMAEIEHIRATQYTQDIVDVLQNKRHTEEELFAVCDAYCKHVNKKNRQANLVKAREAKGKNAEAPKIPA